MYMKFTTVKNKTTHNNNNNNNSKEYKRLNEKKERNNDIDMYACSIYNTNIPYRL